MQDQWLAIAFTPAQGKSELKKSDNSKQILKTSKLNNAILQTNVFYNLAKVANTS